MWAGVKKICECNWDLFWIFEIEQNLESKFLLSEEFLRIII